MFTLTSKFSIVFGEPITSGCSGDAVNVLCNTPVHQILVSAIETAFCIPVIVL